ncbi:MAG TPA: tripartite tricarboxylate transporter TctB family protein [Deferrisomatales bacterium]|nr:tripartite tricarboxylate transporter TctB family protein [Deferrisomatales bacterium]
MSAKLEERLLTLFILLVVLAMTVTATGYRAPARLIPLAVGVLTSCLFVGVAATVFVPRFRRRAQKAESIPLESFPGNWEDEDTDQTTAHRRTEFKIMGSLLVLTAVTYLIGFLPSIFLYVLLFLRFQSKESWRMSLAMAASILAVIYGVFVQALNVPLHSGIF